MSLRYAILGFLSIQPLSGYDLKKAFDRSVRHFWPANQSQIYRTLAELSDQGYVSVEVVEREDRLDKKLYSLTREGRKELHRWLATPLPAQETREPSLIQLFFGSQLDDSELDALLEQEMRSARANLATLGEVYRQHGGSIQTHENPRGKFLELLTLEYGLLANQTLVQWLESVQTRLRNHRYLLKDFSTIEKN